MILFAWLRFIIHDTPIADHDMRWLTWGLLTMLLLWVTLTMAFGRHLVGRTSLAEVTWDVHGDNLLPDM